MKKVALTISQDEKDYYLRRRYIDYLSNNRRGLMPVILPPTNDASTIREYAQISDGLILTGGGDIDPQLYGEQKEKACGEIHRLRDEFEISLTNEMLLLDKPILGICRGIQVINVTLGGTLWQDIDVVVHAHICAGKPIHDVLLSGRMRDIIGHDSIVTNSYHHQSIRTLGQGLTPVAHSRDGHIEAVWGKDYPFLCGVQWHPEMDDTEYSKNLIREFYRKL
jgi:putative glutamine amidotransferase